jgi:ComF family protein
MEPVFDDLDEEAEAEAAAQRRGRLRGLLRPRVWHAGLRAFSRGIVDFIAPPLCAGCGARVVEPTSLCPSCWGQMHFIERPFCNRLAIPFEIDHGPGVISPAAIATPPPWTEARAAALYEGLAGELVRRFKYADRHDVLPVIAHLTARAGRELLERADLVMPVPLHSSRLRSRRYNQAAMLALRVGKAHGVPVLVDGLVRKRATVPQVSLSRAARARNVAGAFGVSPRHRARIKGQAIVLVDDVLTSGATLASATRALLRAGAGRVDVLVFARAGEAIAGV